ncbi:MAG TPA: short chain dehydrogenase, partial [Amycolatopsis sp.]|nr:short chain dehydrogenase [Amycolatopsis sp.]
SAELRAHGIAANSLWPRTTIDTAAVRNVIGAEVAQRSRKPEIMADAAHVILTKPSAEVTGNFFIDDEVLAAEGVTDFAKYRLGGSEEDLELDIWVDRRR